MKRPLVLLTLAGAVVGFVLGCRDVSTGPGPADVEGDEESIYIVDMTGKKWDVTHAKKKYGMEPSAFQFGIGPDTIRPILNPRMLQPGDRGYPADNEEFLVLGVDLNGSARAYPIDIMIRHEVADEKFGEAHVAVAY